MLYTTYITEVHISLNNKSRVSLTILWKGCKSFPNLVPSLSISINLSHSKNIKTHKLKQSLTISHTLYLLSKLKHQSNTKNHKQANLEKVMNNKNNKKNQILNGLSLRHFEGINIQIHGGNTQERCRNRLSEEKEKEKRSLTNLEFLEFPESGEEDEDSSEMMKILVSSRESYEFSNVFSAKMKISSKFSRI